MDTFLGTLVQLHCGEGGTLQTNNPDLCSQCLSHTGPSPTHSVQSSGSRLLCWETSKAGPGLHVLPRSKPLRFRHSGSPQRCRLSWARILCPSQVREAQVMRCLVSAVAVTYGLSHPAAQFSGCTTSALSRTLRTLSWQRKLLAVW